MSASRPQRALKHYFSPGNLTALRELALRRTAERVDDQMLSYMREHAITGPWGAGERVLVCVDPGPDAANTVRAAKRTADGLDAELIALYVETDRHALLSEAEQARLAEALRLAEQLGAEVVRVPGRSVVEEILAFARSAQCHARGGRQVAPLALVRAAPRLGGRRAGAQRLGPCRRGGAVRRQGRAAGADRLAVRRAAHHRPLSRGRR